MGSARWLRCSDPAGVDRFSGCENLRHECHMIMRHVKDPFVTASHLGKTSLRLLDLDLYEFQFTEPAREDCLLLAACHNGHSDRTLSAAVLPWRPEENLKHTKKTEQTRTIRQIYRD
ncbi:hypothetical protein TNCV_5113191 [Trichonephila clavipes]|nr:hypothetical protein TNCV_5113191 [Trichonephila clavipes]